MTPAAIELLREIDIPQYIELIRRTLRVSNSCDYDKNIIENLCALYTPESVRSLMAKRTIFITKESGEVLATGGIEKEILYGIFVDPEFQGRGFGREIIGRLEAKAREDGIATLTAPASITAVEFYRHLGYTQTTEENDPRFGRVIIMTKEISMANPLCNDIAIQFEKMTKTIKKTIYAFSSEQWLEGISDFEVPAKVAYHIVDCLDNYFHDHQGSKYEWGHKFGSAWRERSDATQPSQEAVAQYLTEIASQIGNLFKNMNDDDLSALYRDDVTNLGHYIYAIRHTMHHQGALTALAVYHKCDPDVWE
jgi:GNAT superfamily N-acetyltransferase